MTIDVSGAYLKLARAKEHLDLISEEADTFVFNGELAFTGVAETDGTNDWEIYSWNDDIPNPDPRWGVYLGDFAHNARSLLDQLLWLLVIANNQKPGKHTQFPICKKAREWRDAVAPRPLDKEPAPTTGLSGAALAVIDRAQPYHLPDQERISHPLAILQSISNVDKHQTLHVAGIGTSDGIEVEYVPPGYIQIIKYIQGPGAQHIKAGAEIGRAQIRYIRQPPPNTQVKVGLKGSAQVEFGEPGKPASVIMRDINRIFERVAVLIADLTRTTEPSIHEKLRRIAEGSAS